MWVSMVKLRLLFAVMVIFSSYSACIAYDEWVTDDEDFIDISSGLIFESNNTIQGYGLVSEYQHIGSQKHDHQSGIDMSKAISGTGFYSHKSSVSSSADYDIDDESNEVTGVDEEINLNEEISASYEEGSFHMGRSFKTGPLKLSWKLDTLSRNHEKGIAARYLFDNITAINHKARLEQITDASNKNETYLDLDSRFTGIGYLSMLVSPIQESIHPLVPELEVEEKYIGSFHLAKKIELDIEDDEISEEDEIWLSCCDDGLLPDVNIFNCSCQSGR